jgi:hypothetical protein
MASKSSMTYFIIVLVILVVAVVASFQGSRTTACTEEAKVCPDGSTVGRVPPNCEFAPCPTSCTCPEGYVQEGDSCNPECYYNTPPCLMPSISCSSTCGVNSDCVGSTCCHPTSCINKAYKGVCDGACTAVCEGPLDCGAGSCGCVNNRCTVIPCLEPPCASTTK